MITQLEDLLRGACRLGKQDEWREETIPTVPLRLGILLDSLNRNIPKFWNEEPEELTQVLIQNHPKLAESIREYDQLAIGFAVRTIRIQSRDSGQRNRP